MAKREDIMLNKYGSMPKAGGMVVTNENGDAFYVVILRSGDTYGRNGCLTWGYEKYSLDGDGVEFYDTHNSDDRTEWQFVSRYYLDTLLKHPRDRGLDLHGGVPKWTIDAPAMEAVIAMLERETIFCKMAKLIERRADLTSEIVELWNELTPEQEDAMNNIIENMTKADSPVVSMSLDELVLAEREWADEVLREVRDEQMS